MGPFAKTVAASGRAKLLQTSLAAVMPHLNAQALQGKNIFITGGTGFFGLWLLSALSRLQCDGVDVRVTVLSRDPAALQTRHPQFAQQQWLSFVQGDIRTFAAPAGTFDLLIHGAAETSAAAHANPMEMFDTITSGMRHLVEFAASAGVRRMLLLSSGAVYGPQSSGVDLIPEDSPSACSTLQPGSAYGEGKRVMEWLAAVAQQSHGIDSIVARCFAFAGPGLPMDGHFAIGNFIHDALFGDAIHVRGDGSAMRSYLYGADLAVWLLKLLTLGQAGRVYHVGSDQGLSIRELASTVRDVLAPGKPVVFQNQAIPGAAARNMYVPSIRRAREELGLAPWTSIESCLRLSADYYAPRSEL